MVKLLDPARWIENMYEVLSKRAKAAGLARPLTITFDTGRAQYRLELTRRSGHLVRDDAATADVSCTPDMLGASAAGKRRRRRRPAIGPNCDPRRKDG